MASCKPSTIYQNLNKRHISVLFEVGALITQKHSSIILEEGQNVSLVCQATGKPTPTVTWRKFYATGMKPRFKVDKIKLTISSVTKEDGGEYVCSAKNLLNEDSAAAQIH